MKKGITCETLNSRYGIKYKTCLKDKNPYKVNHLILISANRAGYAVITNSVGRKPDWYIVKTVSGVY